MARSTRTTGTVLDRIVESCRTRLEADRRDTPEAALAELAAARDPAIDFAARLREGRSGSPAGARLRLIAEVKRASPSKGVFDADLDAANQATAYADAGATAVSVLTERDHFSGSPADLAAARDAVEGADRPALLRKDFIFDRYQVVQARAWGADALLLIVALLKPATLDQLLAATREQGLEALVEVHDEAEMEAAAAAGARVIGINNRNLHDFSEDLATTERLAPLAPTGCVVVAESAIRERADAERMAEAGVHAVLVGEALVRPAPGGAVDIAAKARKLMLAEERLA
ncbi:MAG TPA: indole-3-glycerol phosphate synthase TrpC [Dehalococcoidia bacterium]|jgi:indole-3-glycerol phosphate synthase|nr:indole-3-glycerol phosphate synthase TrpC [Dehalococcoidia bacterium]